MFRSSLIRRSLSLVLIGTACTATAAFAQGGGGATAGLSAAASQVRGAFTTVQTLMYAICAIMGVVGAINVYSKWSNGDPDTRKSAASWFGALIFAGLVVAVLQGVFG